MCEVAARHGVREIVDLACGTGKMSELLLRRGYDVVGVDASSEMLNIARQKCKAAFICQDMRKLSLAHRADMAVCVNDGVNYLKPTELAPFFARVADGLKVGAPFVFDVSSPFKLTNKVGDNVFYWDDELQTLLWSNAFRGDRVEMDLVLFERRGDVYCRSDERHVQYVHEAAAVVSALAQAGFDVVEQSDSYGGKLTEQALRLAFYAIKR